MYVKISLFYFRPGLCGAWSFDTSEDICYLHNIDSCCGQFGKRVQKVDFISGYSCTHCWSTKKNTDCPCSADDRKEIPAGTTGHGSGGKSPEYATASVISL